MTIGEVDAAARSRLNSLLSTVYSLLFAVYCSLFTIHYLLINTNVER